MPWPPPFRSLDQPRAVFSWGVYDLANQSFQLLINTLLFPLFITGVVVTTEEGGDSVWFMMSASSLGLIVLLSPVLGAVADQRAWKRELLIATGLICSLLTFALGFIQPGQIALAFALYLTAAVACGLGENFLGSFLPEISTPRTVGRVSAIGWTMSYIGALALLGITAAFTIAFGRTDPSQMRPLLFFSGIWFGVGMLPALFWLREKTTPSPTGAATIITGAFVRLVASARETTRYRQLARFFLAFAVYSAGTMTMIYGLGVIGDRLGFGLRELILMALVIALTAGASAAVAGRVQDSFGHVRTISVFLALWVLASLAMAGAEVFRPPTAEGGAGLATPATAVYWIVSGMIGVALGGIGTASRAIVGAFTPADRAGEFFGLWGMIYKGSGMIGVGLFGFLGKFAGQPAALLAVAGLFGLGWLLLLRVDEHAGIRAAEGAPGSGLDSSATVPAGPSNDPVGE